MANILRREKQEAVLRAIMDGASVRATERMVGVHRDTILRLMVRVADGCARILDTKFQGVQSRRIEIDEIWGYVAKKQRHVTVDDDPRIVGDFWTFVAIDPESKIVPSFRVGKRDVPTATAFLQDLSGRLANRVQLSSDAMKGYIHAAEIAFRGQVDYGQIVKFYEAEPLGPGRYSPPKVIGVQKTVLVGDPDMDTISTSIVKRQNLSMRMSLRRLTRLTNGFSKRVENLRAAITLYFAYYNLVRPHQTLRCSPAMAAGIETSLWSMGDLLDAATAN